MRAVDAKQVIRSVRTGVLSYALHKGPEAYVVVFEPALLSEAVCTVARWADSDSLSLTWHDAATMAVGMKKLVGQ